MLSDTDREMLETIERKLIQHNEDILLDEIDKACRQDSAWERLEGPGRH
jgi:hypothetical protein